MKWAILLILAVASTTLAATDPYVHERVVQLQQLNNANLAADPQLIAALGQANKESGAKDKTIEAQAKQIAELGKQSTRTIQFFVGGAGVVAIIGGGVFGFFLLKKWDVAIGSMLFGMGLISLSLAISYYGKALATVGIGATVIGFLVFVTWLIVRLRKNEIAGTNHAGVIDILEAAGLPAYWVAKARAVQYKTAGPIGDFMTAQASGKRVQDVKIEGEKAAAVAATPAVPVSYAVTSGVSTPI